MRAAALTLALLAGCTTQSADDRAARSAGAILAEMKSACGGDAWDRVQGWHETGVVEVPGRPPMDHQVWHDMRSLKTAMVTRLDGQIVRHSGFNGATYWQVGRDGTVQAGADPNKLRSQLRDTYLSSAGWFFPKRFPAAIALAGTESSDGKSVDVLRITPEGAGSFDLWVDRDTHRIRRIVASNEFAELSDYRMFGGVCSATRGRQGDGDPAHDIVLHVRTVETDAPIPAATFEPPAKPSGE
jgi:hypothetical protein